MRIIIAGDGEVGLYLAQELSKENHHITMIAPTEELVKTIESHGMLYSRWFQLSRQRVISLLII